VIVAVIAIHEARRKPGFVFVFPSL